MKSKSRKDNHEFIKILLKKLKIIITYIVKNITFKSIEFIQINAILNIE